MLNFLVWYVFLSLLGILAFPLAFRLFPALKGRGYAFSRTLGLLGWGYLFWLGASLNLLRNDPGGLFLALFLFGGISLFAARNSFDGIRAWVRERRSYILQVEILFFAAFAFLAMLRAANPDIVGTEKPMELAFINAILRSPTFPPHDPWLSGYAISYYYFGYVMTAMLARLTATPGSVAFNLMVSLAFALSAVGAYGVLYALLEEKERVFAWLAPLFLVLSGNFEGLLEVMHARGWLGAGFWAWLDIKDLSAPPASPYGWIPRRFWWWWRASRVVQDYDLAGNFQEVIDEFPFFSYLLGDLHPHVLAMPFGLLAVAAALNLFRGGWRGELPLFGARLSISREGFAFGALLLGGLAFLNTWDILIAAALLSSAYALARVREAGWAWERLEDFFVFGMLSGIAAILLYLSFYLGFSSQAGGILPNLVTPTRGAHLWVMFGTLLLPLFFWMGHLRREKFSADWKNAFALTLGLVGALWAFSWILAWLFSLLRPQMVAALLSSQGFEHSGAFFVAATLKRSQYIGGLLTILAAISGALAFFLPSADSQETDSSSRRFVWLLILLGGLLVLAPEFLYLKDQFGTRMNTVFKFYYQAWMLWSLAAAYGAAKIFHSGKKAAGGALILVLLAALIYPVLGVWTQTNHFHPPFGWSLDGAAHLQRENADEAAAIQALWQMPTGILSEAVGGSYSGYARISTYTGLPTVLGWTGHEAQWRGGYEEQGDRMSDIETLYTSSDWNETAAILAEYHIRYVYIGALERTTYHVNETKFQQHLPLVLHIGEVNVYEVP